MVTISTMSLKMATLGLLKIKGFLFKCYNVIISVNDISNKILSGESICNLDVVRNKVW